MELQAQLAALEEEVGMLKGEIKAILQEVRVAVLARQNPFLADDLDKAFVRPTRSPSAFDLSEAATIPTPTAAPEPIQAAAAAPEPAPRVVLIPPPAPAESDDTAPPLRTTKRPVDLAALMVWVQEAAETFTHVEFVMLVTMASYADFFDDGLKQALLDMSQEIARDHTTKASLADFSLALKKLEAIRASTTQNRQAA